jgi:hypothetical protein
VPFAAEFVFTAPPESPTFREASEISNFLHKRRK